MKILQEVEQLIDQVSEAFNSVVGGYEKMLNDINDLETNKATIMKLPGMRPEAKAALLQHHIDNTEQLKQLAIHKQQAIANYSSDLVNKYSQSIQKPNAKSSRDS